MKKKYHLSYEFLGDKRSLEFNHLGDFYMKLDDIYDHPHVNQQSIAFHTEDLKEETPA